MHSRQKFHKSCSMLIFYFRQKLWFAASSSNSMFCKKECFMHFDIKMPETEQAKPTARSYYFEFSIHQKSVFASHRDENNGKIYIIQNDLQGVAKPNQSRLLQNNNKCFANTSAHFILARVGHLKSGRMINSSFLHFTQLCFKRYSKQMGRMHKLHIPNSDHSFACVNVSLSQYLTGW